MRLIIRLSVAIAVISPLFLLFGGGWLTTFAIALVGFGLGRFAEQLLFGPAQAQETGRTALWMAPAVAALGAMLLAVVQLVELRRARTHTEVLEEQLKQERAIAEVTAQEVLPQERVWQVVISTDGSLQSDGAKATLESLAAPEGVTRAELRVQADVPYAQIVATMDKIQAAGISEITLTD